MNIIRDSFYLTVSKGIRTIVMMAVVMVMTRITSMQIYGTYRQLITLSTIILAIAPLGIPTSVSYYYKNLDLQKRNKLISNTIIICLLCGIASSSFFIVCKSQISSSLNIEEINNYLLSFSLYVFILVVSSFIENLYVCAEYAKSFSIFNGIYYIAFFVLVVGVVFKSSKLSTMIFTMAFLEATRFIILLVWIVKKIDFRFVVDFSFIREQFIYCIPLGLVGMMQVLNTHLDKLLVSGYFTSSDFAIYSTGTMEIPIVNLITISLATAALPHMSKEYNTSNNIKGVLQIWGKITITSAVILFPIFFILGFYNKGYIGFFFSEKYFSCIPIFLVRLIRLPLSCTVFGNILIIMKKQKVIIFNMFITIIVNIIGNIILIPILGMQGATLSGVIMHITVIMLQLYQISKYTNVKIKNLMPYKDLLKIFSTSFIVVLPIYFISTLFTMHYVISFMLFGCIAFFASIAVLSKLKFIELDLKNRLSVLFLNKTRNLQFVKK